MFGVVAPVDQSKAVPEVVNTELPQLLTTVTTGVAGTVHGGVVQIFNPQPSRDAGAPTAEVIIDKVQIPVEDCPFHVSKDPIGR
jgi:hypothetical protein